MFGLGPEGGGELGDRRESHGVERRPEAADAEGERYQGDGGDEKFGARTHVPFSGGAGDYSEKPSIGSSTSPLIWKPKMV